jgi:hypothetical protein
MIEHPSAAGDGVEAAERLQGCARHASHVVESREINRKDTPGRQQAAQPTRLGIVANHDSTIRTLARVPLEERAADAGSGTGNENSLWSC